MDSPQPQPHSPPQHRLVVKEEHPGVLGVMTQPNSIHPDYFGLPSQVVRGYSVGKAVEIWGVPSLQCSAEEYDDLVRRQVVQRELAAAKEVQEMLMANPELRLESRRDESGKRRWFIVRQGSIKQPCGGDHPRRMQFPLACDS